MSPEELDAKLEELTEAANNLSGLDKIHKLNEIDEIKDKRDGMALGEIRGILDQISLPDLADLDAKIEAAKKADQDNRARADAINVALGILKTALKIVV